MRNSNFIRPALIILFAGIVMQGMFSCKPAPKQKTIGLQLYSLRDDMKKDPQGTVAKVGQIGYKFVEAAGYSDGKFYGMEPAEFKALCENNGLQFLGSHTGHDLPDSANYAETMAWWDKCIEAHAAAGVKWIVQPWMSHAGYESLEGIKKYCDYFNEVGEKCNAKGIRFGYHNHSGEFNTQIEGKPVYDYMLQYTDPEKVMFEMDLYWIVDGGGNPLEYFEKNPGRFFVWHIKDKEEVGASGKMDFASIFAARQKAGTQYGVVEIEQYNFEPIVSCQKSLEFLNAADYVDF